MKKVSKNTSETTQIAKIFLNKIIKNNNSAKGALVIGLSGDLGTGKTTFTQAIARHLGIKEKVNSPTVVIIKKYSIVGQIQQKTSSIKNAKYKFLFHLDAYRLKNEKELLYLGWDKIISNKEHLVFIEWPENVLKVIPATSVFIHISHTNQGYRNFEFK